MNSAVDFNILTLGQQGREIANGETVFSAGDPGSEMFIVKSGTVDIVIDGRVVETVGQNGIFGEMALIDGSPRSATVVATSDSVIVPVAERQFVFMVEKTPYFALNVLRTLARRLRTANQA